MKKISFIKMGVATLLVGTGSCVYAAPYKLTDLGSLGGTTAYAYSINEQGVVVGAASGANGSNGLPLFSSHAFRWDPTSTTMTDMGHFGGNESSAYFVDASGRVYGYSTEAVGQGPRGFKTDIDGLVISDVGTPPAETHREAPTQLRVIKALDNQSFVGYSNYDVNITTTSTTTDGVTTVTENKSFRDRAVMWDATEGLFKVFRTLVPLKDGLDQAAATSVARAINSGRQVVGYSSPDETSANLHAVQFNPEAPLEVPTDLHPSWAGGSSQANDINNAGKVVGLSHTSSSTTVTAFFTDVVTKTAVALGQLSSAMTFSEANAINNDNIVVGNAQYEAGSRSRTHAFIWKDNGTATPDPITDLNTLVDCDFDADTAGTQHMELIEARDINDKGQIVGSGIIDGKMHAFRLDPPNLYPPFTDVVSAGTACEVDEEDKPDGGSWSFVGVFTLLLAGMWRRRKN